MIVDSSAIVAILRAEPDAEVYARAIEAANVVRISAVNYVEAAVVADGSKDPRISRHYDEIVRAARIEICSINERHARLAREAYRDFGKGTGHPAKLNFGDCFAYALAKDFGEPLLFKGADFLATDISPAIPSK